MGQLIKKYHTYYCQSSVLELLHKMRGHKEFSRMVTAEKSSLFNKTEEEAGDLTVSNVLNKESSLHLP